MKKIAVLIALLTVLSFASCGQKTEMTERPQQQTSASAVHTDAPQSAQAWIDLLSSELPFDDTMTKVPEQANALYGILDEDGYTGDSSLLISTMATPEEIAVFQTDAALSAEQLTALAQARLDRQKESYASYAPQEMPKIESAVVRTCGNYVIVVVCADNAMAQTILDTYA